MFIASPSTKAAPSTVTAMRHSVATRRLKPSMSQTAKSAASTRLVTVVRVTGEELTI